MNRKPLLYLAGATLLALIVAGLWLMKHPSPISHQPSIKTVTTDQLLQEIKSTPEKLALVHLWAIWCEPCIKELPLLKELRQSFQGRGLVVYIVSVDFPSQTSQVEDFLRQHKIDFTTYMRDPSEGDERFISSLYPNWNGALPANIIFNGQGQAIEFWQGESSAEDFQSAVTKALTREEQSS